MTDDLKFKSADLQAVDATARSARFVASTDAIDSYGEIVNQNWILDRYKANPIVLYNHMRTGSDLPIGTATVEMVGGKLECVITFASAKASPLAERVWNLVQERVLRAVSVGFRPRNVRTEVRDGEEVVLLDDNELYEISVTPIGANPEALAKMKALGLDMHARPLDREGGAQLAAILGAACGDLSPGEIAAGLVDLGFDASTHAEAPNGRARAPGHELADMLADALDRDDLTSLGLESDGGAEIENDDDGGEELAAMLDEEVA